MPVARAPFHHLPVPDIHLPAALCRRLLLGAFCLLLAPAPAAAMPALPVVPAPAAARDALIVQREPIALAASAAPTRDAPAFQMPVDDYRLSSAFGPRRHPIRGRVHEHSGADMAAPRGTAVRAVAAGTVQVVKRQATGYGHHVVVAHNDGYSSWYAHLERIDGSVSVGMQIAAGQMLGAVGSSGSATGPHLHLEIRLDDVPQEPMALLQQPILRSNVGVSPTWRANAAPP